MPPAERYAPFNKEIVNMSSKLWIRIKELQRQIDYHYEQARKSMYRQRRVKDDIYGDWKAPTIYDKERNARLESIWQWHYGQAQKKEALVYKLKRKMVHLKWKKDQGERWGKWK